MELKYEFDNWEEYNEAMKHLRYYHDCEKCYGKVVGIKMDKVGNTYCAYCGQIVKYPLLKKEVYKKWMKKGVQTQHLSQA